MTTRKRILIIGGTRGTGQLITRRLADDGFHLRLLAHNAERARAQFDRSVEIVRGDVTDPRTLAPAIADMDHLIYTAGVTKRPAAEAIIRATEFDGVLNTIAAAREIGFSGRFLLMGAIGTTRTSLISSLLNFIKGNTLQWRRRAERALRDSGLEYTIIHAGILVDGPAGARPIEVSQHHYPMRWRHRISRADAAEVFARALLHPSARNATFDAVWARDGRIPELERQFEELQPDSGTAVPIEPLPDGHPPPSRCSTHSMAA
jgi:uncharacterized protein YbjT (DUF2867 family)